MRISNAFGLSALAFVLLFSFQQANATPVVVTAAGQSLVSNNTNWVSDGLATLGGGTSGVDWTVSGLRQNADWIYNGDGGQRGLDVPTVEWPTAGNFSTFGYTLSFQNMSIGPSMQADVVAGGGTLVISEVAPAPGVYTLNGVSQTATALGAVLEWYAASGTNLALGNTLSYTSTALDPAGSIIANGPIGFSAVVPEPSSFILCGLGAAGLFFTARRRRKA